MWQPRVAMRLVVVRKLGRFSSYSNQLVQDFLSLSLSFLSRFRALIYAVLSLPNSLTPSAFFLI